ncbi:MAG TPA: phosphoesterase, partial [Dehalococcoidia bacterium]|nr:phosphoesterase [Dehalococcoidia bacterium]
MLPQRSRRRFLRAALGALAGAAAGGLPLAPRATARAATRQRATPNVVVQWNQAGLQAVRATHPGPPMVARALAVLHTCIFDAWAMYDPVAAPTAAPVVLKQPDLLRTPENKQQAVSLAAYAALADLFPDQLATFQQLLTALGYDAATATPGSPADVGLQCAAAVLALRHADGSNQLGDLHPGAYSDYTGYTPVNAPDTPLEQIDPDHWQPLYVPDGQGGFAAQQYIGPHWGLVTPFALSSGAQFRPDVGPARYGTPEYQQQADQLLAISAALTDEQKVITEFWADGPGTVQPPGHWCQIGQFVSQRDGYDLDTDVVFFFLLSNALFDAGIACWDAKRVWDSVRPITAVHYLYRGQTITAWGGPYRGTQTMPGEAWL